MPRKKVVPVALVTPTALRRQDVDGWVGGFGLRAIHALHHELRKTLYWWVGLPSPERLDAIIERMPILEECIDFSVLVARLKKLPKFPGATDPFGVGLTSFAPELGRVYQSTIAAADASTASSLERAEAWLAPIAKDAGADADLEAAIYFASRGDLSIADATTISTRWLRVLQHEVSRDESARQARAGQPTLSATEAFRVLAAHGYVTRFLAFHDSEESYIDAAFIRAVQWYGIQGFDAWEEAFLVSGMPAGPSEPLAPPGYWWLFHQLRSDTIMARTYGPAAQAWLWALMHSGEHERPWAQFGWGHEGTTGDYFPIAAIHAFAWHRLSRPDFARELTTRALALLIANQHADGGWPLSPLSSESNLLATCSAIHALATCKPESWKSACMKAVGWVERAQDSFGYWSIQGGPTVMLTVLALDSISMAQGRSTTFNIMLTAVAADEEPAVPIYDCENQPWHAPILPSFASKPSTILQDIGIELLLVVATEVELTQVLAVMTPLFRKTKLWQIRKGSTTYYIGRFGVHAAAALRCSMGSVATSGAALAVNDAIRDLDPRAVVMPGLAFGLDRDKQLPGDILVARSIIPYESQRRGDGVAVPRAPQPEASMTLVDRLSSPGWSFLRPDGTPVRRYEGAVLSGEKLVADVAFRDELQGFHPNAIGGEMEGAGLASACSRNRVDWALAKAVCDWADGKKHDGYQEMAAAASVSLCLHVFTDKHALDGVPPRRS